MCIGIAFWFWFIVIALMNDIVYVVIFIGHLDSLSESDWKGILKCYPLFLC